MINIHSASEKGQVKLERDIFLRNAEETLAANGIERIEHQEALANSLFALYSARDRFYHTYVHINLIFENTKRYCEHLSPSERLAVLFHDAIYVAGQEDNEGRSVDLMVMMMAGFGVPITEYCWASRCIRETAHHLGHVHDPSTHAVLDLDIAHFGGNYVDFVKIGDLVAKEFPNATPEDHADFIEKFLEKDKIYYRLTQLEEPARENIRQYIEQLRNGHTS